MRMAVEGERGAELIERPGEARGAEEGEDLQRLALHGLPRGRVVQERDAVPRAQLEERFLQLELLFDAGVHERLDCVLAELLQLRLLEPARESLDAGNAV